MNTRDKLNEKIEKLIGQVELAGSWIKPFKQAMSCGMPQNFSTGVNYKGANVFFLWLEAMENGYSSNNWLTMNQCNKLKGKVIKGSKATPIFFFKPLSVNKEIEKDGKTETVEQYIPMLKTYYVFNIEQTTLKIEDIETIENSNNELIEECENFFNALDFINVKDNNSPFYSPIQDFIGMPSINKFIDSEEYYATLAHEFIHSTGHTTRLNRDMSNKKASYAYEELIAELGSAFVSAHLGIDKEPIQDNCKAYLKSWLKHLKDDKKYLWKAMSEASKAFEFLINASQEEKHYKCVA